MNKRRCMRESHVGFAHRLPTVNAQNCAFTTSIDASRPPFQIALELKNFHGKVLTGD